MRAVVKLFGKWKISDDIAREMLGGLAARSRERSAGASISLDGIPLVVVIGRIQCGRTEYDDNLFLPVNLNALHRQPGARRSLEGLGNVGLPRDMGKRGWRAVVLLRSRGAA